MSLNFDVRQGVFQNTGHRLIQDFHGFRFQLGTARLKVHTLQFHTGIVKYHRNAARTCSRRHIGGFSTCKGASHAFAKDIVGFLTRNMERHLAFGIGSHSHFFLGIVLAHKSQLFMYLGNIFIVGISYSQHGMRLVGQQFTGKSRSSQKTKGNNRNPENGQKS